MDTIYINDTHFKKSSGEIYHTVGFLNSVEREMIFITTKNNKDILKQKIKNNKILIIYKTNLKIFRILYIIYFVIRNHNITKIYLRKSFFTVFYVVFFNRNIFVEVNGVASEESKGIELFLNKISDYITYKNKKVDKYICVSWGIKQYLADKYGLKNLFVVENGVGEKFKNFKVVSRKSSNRFVFVGGFSQWQNFKYLIKVVRENLELINSKGIYIDLYGDGPVWDDVYNLIRENGLSKILRLKGFVDNEKLIDEIGSASFGLLLDKRFYKGLPLFSPLKYYEYKSLGLSVVLLYEGEDLMFYDDVKVLNVGNFSTWWNSYSQKTENGAYTRSWKKVLQETEELINV